MPFLLFLIQIAAAISQMENCTTAHSNSVGSCGSTAPAANVADCLAKADACYRTCNAFLALPASMQGLNEPQAARSFVAQCGKSITDNNGTLPDPNNPDGPTGGLRNAGDDATKCRSYKAKVATQALIDGLADDEAQQCLDACTAATTGKGPTEALYKELDPIGKKCYSALPADPKLDVASVPPKDDGTGQDPPGGGDDGSSTNSDATTPGGTNGISNNNNGGGSFPGMAGGFSPPSVGTDLSGNIQSVNWATGPDPNPDIYSAAAQGVAQSEGFEVPTGIPLKLSGSGPVIAPDKPAAAPAAPSMPAAPVGPSLGGGGGPSGSPAPARSNGGGGRGPVAATQLGKVGNNTYYSGGGSMVPSRAVAAKTKRSPYGTRYNPKTEDGATAALARMFGRPVRPSSGFYNRHYYGANRQYAKYAEACQKNTIFCGVETRLEDLLMDYDTGDDTAAPIADTSKRQQVRGTASDKKH